MAGTPGGIPGTPYIINQKIHRIKPVIFVLDDMMPHEDNSEF